MRFSTCYLLLAYFLCAFANVPQPPAQRTFNIQVNQLQMQIVATYQNNSYQDQYYFEIDLNQQNQGIIKANFQYHVQGAQNQTQIQFQLAVSSVVEYNGTEVYEGDTKDILSQWPAGQSVQWEYWRNESRMDGNTPLHIYSSNTKDGRFYVRIHAASVDVTFPDGPPLSPNNVKIDFGILNYPFTKGAEGRLAMLTKVTGQSQSVNSGQGAVNDNNLLFGAIGSNLPFGSFSWADQATPIPSNHTIAVVAWSPTQSASNAVDIFFSFLTPRGGNFPTNILWDPRIGLDYDSGNIFCLGSLCGGSAIAVIVVIVVAVATVVTVGIACAILKKKQRPYQVIQ